MTEEQEQLAAQIAESQLRMNEHTIAVLKKNGLREGDLVQLDFMFVAPEEASAAALGQFLAANGCDGVEVAANEEKTEYFVTGKSQPTSVSSRTVDRWVQWMVVQGVIRNCQFDGWGAEAPGAEA
jgi:hypothetical protein